MSEMTVWNQFRKKVARAGHFERIENSVSFGRPDTNYCMDGFAGDIEFKFRAKPPVRESTPCFPKGKGLRKQQIAWMIKRVRAKGMVFIYAVAGKEHFLLRVHENTIREFNSYTLSELRILSILSRAMTIAALIRREHERSLVL